MTDEAELIEVIFAKQKAVETSINFMQDCEIKPIDGIT